MKKTILTFAILLSAFAANAQEIKKQKDDGVIIANTPVADGEDTIYTQVEVKPAFPGGFAKFYDYIAKNLNIPRSFKGGGRIIATFVVEKDGSLAEVKIMRGLDENLDKEAIRVLKASPKWTPGSQSGKPVRVMYSLPISIKER